jgi:hypothetical protein
VAQFGVIPLAGSARATWQGAKRKRKRKALVAVLIKTSKSHIDFVHAVASAHSTHSKNLKLDAVEPHPITKLTTL